MAEKEKAERETAVKHKIMVIPFEPRLYFSEIDRAINAETKLNAKQIKYVFRDGLDAQITKALKKAGFGVIDLMSDTIKYRKDTEGIYHYLTYAYQKVPDQNNYKPPVKEKSQNAIEKGQLNVETNSEQRFMNAKLTSPNVVPGLYGKYKTDLFIFINQLDLKAGGSTEPYQPYKAASAMRKIVVHYTVYTFDAKEINSGTIEEEFSEELNEPKRIVDKHFSKIAQVLLQRIQKGLVSSK